MSRGGFWRHWHKSCSWNNAGLLTGIRWKSFPPELLPAIRRVNRRELAPPFHRSDRGEPDRKECNRGIIRELVLPSLAGDSPFKQIMEALMSLHDLFSLVYYQEFQKTPVSLRF